MVNGLNGCGAAFSQDVRVSPSGDSSGSLMYEHAGLCFLKAGASLFLLFSSNQEALDSVSPLRIVLLKICLLLLRKAPFCRFF